MQSWSTNNFCPLQPLICPPEGKTGKLSNFLIIFLSLELNEGPLEMLNSKFEPILSSNYKVVAL